MKRFLEFAFVSLLSVIITLQCVKNHNHIVDGGKPNSFQADAGMIDTWKMDISKSFDEAEIKIYNITPKPDIVGPDEDPKKCICKGTGVIKHGDGHTTPCPYHSKQFSKPLIILEE